MQVVQKHRIDLTNTYPIVAPSDALVLQVGIDEDGNPSVWMQVETENPTEPYQIFAIGTGVPIPDNATRFLGSIVDSRFVYHIFI